MLHENKACQIFQKTNISYQGVYVRFSENLAYCFLVTPVLKFAFYLIAEGLVLTGKLAQWNFPLGQKSANLVDSSYPLSVKYQNNPADNYVFKVNKNTRTRCKI